MFPSLCVFLHNSLWDGMGWDGKHQNKADSLCCVFCFYVGQCLVLAGKVQGDHCWCAMQCGVKLVVCAKIVYEGAKFS